MMGCKNVKRERKQKEGRCESKCLEISLHSGILGKYQSCDGAFPDGKKGCPEIEVVKKNPTGVLAMWMMVCRKNWEYVGVVGMWVSETYSVSLEWQLALAIPTLWS